MLACKPYSATNPNGRLTPMDALVPAARQIARPHRSMLSTDDWRNIGGPRAGSPPSPPPRSIRPTVRRLLRSPRSWVRVPRQFHKGCRHYIAAIQDDGYASETLEWRLVGFTPVRHTNLGREETCCRRRARDCQGGGETTRKAAP
jgi:hypothetical protein